MIRHPRRLARGLFAVAAFALTVIAGSIPVAAAEGVTPLVSTAWLKQHLADADLVVLDIRSVVDGGGADAYRAGHVSGAVHSDYDKAGWRVTRNDLPLMLPSVAELEKLIGETGIDEESRVVIVPAGVSVLDFGAAARIYWTLKVVSHPRVSILDGGFAAWKADPTNPIETAVHVPSPKIFTAVIDKTLLASATEVDEARRSGRTLIDARPASFFSGKEKHPRALAYGHIPGARNIDSALLYDPTTNRLKAKDELARVFAAIPAGPATSYCNTGHWAATDWFVFSEILGRKDVKMYPGSMVEWTGDAGRPVESQRTKWDDLKKALGFGT